MDKFLHSRLFRCLVCLILVCCILVNISPLKAESSAIVAGATVSAAGVFATLFAMSMGVVFVDLTANLINGLGDSFVDHVTKSTSTDNETEILKVWIEPIQVDLNSGDISQLPPDHDDDTNTWGALAGLFTLPDELKDNFLDWGKSLINGESQVEVEEEVTAPDGQMYYGDTLLPVIPVSNHPYKYILYSVNEKNTYLYCDDARFYFLKGDSQYLYGQGVCTRYTLTDGAWSSGISVNVSYFDLTKWELSWANCSINDNYGNGVSLFSDPTTSSTTTVPVLPDTYVGDIPQKVQNGDFDDDDLELPYIDPTKLWENQTDAVEALNNVATQLQNGTMTYDQYMEQIQTETSTDPGGSGTGGDSGNTGNSDSGDDSGDDSGEQERPPITDILPYGLDLTDYFPFCIPFDLYDFFTCLDAAPRAPKFHWEIQDLSGGSYAIDIDLSPWDEVAALFRHLQLLLFVVGLAAATRKYIKW